MSDLNPQARQMADESMVRNLDAQARAIWPQERLFFERYQLPAEARILDAGCGTGEIASRLAEAHPQAQVLGVDIIEAHLALARARFAGLAPRLSFEQRSIYELGLPDAQFDLTVCRHVIHSIPHPERVLAELVRVTRPGGWLHLIPEDYGMLQFPRRGPHDPSDFWHVAIAAYSQAMGTDLFCGRHTFGLLAELGLEDIRMDYVVVDTIRVPREIFAGIIEAWRDGYVDTIAEHTPLSAGEVRGAFEQMIEDIRDPRRYAVWFVPVLSGRVGPDQKSA